MILTVFRLRLSADPKDQQEYTSLAPHIGALASKMPGFISAKRFTADDGERVTIVEFEDEESHLAWATHPEHMAAKKLGRSTLFAEYCVQVCEVKKTMKKSAQAL